MIFEPFAPYAPSEFWVKLAVDPWERQGAAALRRKVFCVEQGLFGEDDRDGIDDAALSLVALSLMGVAADEVVGAVRIHEAAPGLWWGSRLAVAVEHRRNSSIGTALIQLAVSSAHARGCTKFFAHVQSQNALLFQRLHWKTLDLIELHGLPHHRMEADLDFYPPCPRPEIGIFSLRRTAA
jgi:putative N-acetyltransferase (TIGR04045 family)